MRDLIRRLFFSRAAFPARPAAVISQSATLLLIEKRNRLGEFVAANASCADNASLAAAKDARYVILRYHDGNNDGSRHFTRTIRFIERNFASTPENTRRAWPLESDNN